MYFLYLPGETYLGEGTADLLESLRDGKAMSRRCLQGFEWTIFGISDTDFCHFYLSIYLKSRD